MIENSFIIYKIQLINYIYMLIFIINTYVDYSLLPNFLSSNHHLIYQNQKILYHKYTIRPLSAQYPILT